MRVRRTGVRRQRRQDRESLVRIVCTIVGTLTNGFLRDGCSAEDVLNARRPEDRAHHGADLWNVLVAFVGSSSVFLNRYPARSLSP